MSKIKEIKFILKLVVSKEPQKFILKSLQIRVEWMKVTFIEYANFVGAR